MNLLSFKGGVHPNDCKEISSQFPLEKAPVPNKVFVFLSNHAGAPCKPLVKNGDKVKTGQKIGEANGFISANLHSPITGEVKGIERIYHPSLGKPAEAIIIERDGEKDDYEYLSTKEYDSYTSKEIIERMYEAGIVGLGGAMFPTNVKFTPPEHKEINTLIINAAECEPYLTVDYRLMLEKTEEILEGIKAAKKAAKAGSVIVGIEWNKEEAIKTFKAYIKNSDIKIAALKTKYPQGAEKQLIYATTKRIVPAGGLPLDVGVVVINVGTVFAIYEALKYGKPLIERAVSVTGEGIKRPRNLISRVGTLGSDLIDYCGGLTENTKKLIYGGPMMGPSVPKKEVPTLKGTSGILAMTEESKKEAFPCIRCGNCANVCPMNLEPYLIEYYGSKRMYDKAVEHGLLNCMECGSCAYGCPAGIDLVKNFKLYKRVYRTLKGGAKK